MGKKITNILFYGIICLLLFGILSQLGILPFRITYILSGSMMPTYAPGDLAVIYTGANQDLKTGDVVYFHSGETPVIHRIKSIENGLITTQGDANEDADQKKLTSVDGKLLFSIPKIGFVIEYIQIPFREIGNIFQ